jgi:hypothetical protein
MSMIKLPASLVLIAVLCCSCGANTDRQLQTETPANNAQLPTSESKPPAQPKAAIDPTKFAIVVAGVGGEEVYTKKFTAQANQLYQALTNRLGFSEKQVFLLTEMANGGPEDGVRESDAGASKRATAEELRKSFASIKSSAKADSLVLIVLIGHGSFDGQEAKFNLVGPDLAAKDYAQLIGQLPTKRVVFVDCSSSSGEFIKPLSAEGRVIITATRSGNEQNATFFAENFIAALTDPEADADKNGRISVLEAFNYATKVTADGFKQKGRLATEHALIDDNGDRVGHEEAAGGDGTLSKTLYLDSKAVEQAGGDAELGRLLRERQRLEEEVEKLKGRKAEMKQEEYDTQLERLLVELAQVNQAIKAKQK